jgi:hypothetical protein
MPAMAAATKTEFSWAIPQRQAVGLDSVAEPTHHQNRQHHRNEEQRGSAARRTGLLRDGRKGDQQQLAVRSTSPLACGWRTRIEPRVASKPSGQCSTRIAAWVNARTGRYRSR